MAQPFKLETRLYGMATPGACESTGEALRYAAEALQEKAERVTGGPLPPITRKALAALYDLASQAYRRGAGASIGHNRADRYEAEAERLAALAAEFDA